MSVQIPILSVYDEQGNKIPIPAIKGEPGQDGAPGTQGPQGQQGTPGQDGADGFSPTITVTTITGGHRLTITDADGSRTVDVLDGETPDTSSLQPKELSEAITGLDDTTVEGALAELGSELAGVNALVGSGVIA